MSTYATPVPGVDTYASAANAAKLAFDQAVAKVGQGRQQLLSQYGYKANIDPSTGTYTNLQVDPNNQYGALQGTLRQHALEDQQGANQAESRGLHGGLANQQVTGLKYAHGAQDAQLGQSFLEGNSGLDQQYLDAQTNENNALYSAQLDAARNAIAQQMFSQPDYSGLDYGTYGDGGGDGTPPPGGDQSAAAIATKQKATTKQQVSRQVATRAVNKAVALGQPVSEHGMGGGYTAPAPARKPAPKPSTYKGKH